MTGEEKQQYAREFLERELYKLHPGTVEYDENGEEI